MSMGEFSGGKGARIRCCRRWGPLCPQVISHLCDQAEEKAVYQGLSRGYEVKITVSGCLAARALRMDSLQDTTWGLRGGEREGG